MYLNEKKKISCCTSIQFNMIYFERLFIQIDVRITYITSANWLYLSRCHLRPLVGESRVFQCSRLLASILPIKLLHLINPSLYNQASSPCLVPFQYNYYYHLLLPIKNLIFKILNFFITPVFHHFYQVHSLELAKIH